MSTDQRGVPVRCAVLGTSAIAHEFTKAAARLPGIEAAVAISRDGERASAFAAEHPGMASSGDRGAVLADPAIDAIYIATPTTLHEHDVMEALEAGKHVLVEKPIATDLAAFDRMHERAPARGLVLLEAARAVHDPAYAVIAETLPRLGRIWHARLEKCQYSSRYDAVRAGEHRRAFDPAYGHSALSDIGIYCVLPAIQLFGEPRGSVSTSQRLGAGGEDARALDARNLDARNLDARALDARGFDASGVVLLEYPGMSVTCRYSKVTAGAVPSAIEGEEGTLLIDSISEPGRVVLRRRDGAEETILDDGPRDLATSMTHEVAHFADLVARGQVEHPWTAISRGAVTVMEKAYGSTSL